MCKEKKCCHVKYARNWAENKTMEKRMILLAEAETEQKSPAKNDKGKRKVGRPAKSEKGKNMVRILLK